MLLALLSFITHAVSLGGISYSTTFHAIFSGVQNYLLVMLITRSGTKVSQHLLVCVVHETHYNNARIFYRQDLKQLRVVIKAHIRTLLNKLVVSIPYFVSRPQSAESLKGERKLYVMRLLNSPIDCWEAHGCRNFQIPFDAFRR